MKTNNRPLPLCRKELFRALVLLLLLGPVTLSSAVSQTTKVIYFMAGPKDHAWPGRHETKNDLLVLKHCIDSATNLRGVKIITRFIYKRTEHDINDMKDAAAIIIESSAEGSEKTYQTHPLFPANTSPHNDTYDDSVLSYLNQVDSLHDAGMGIVVLHWAVVTDNLTARDHYIRWFGGTSLPNYTQNPLGFWKVTPLASGKKSPILNGVGPWTYKDEIFSKLMVIPGDPYRTDLLEGQAARTNMGPVPSRCIAWAYEHGKARGLLWGGMDYHSALLNDNYRRFLLNAIVWAAGIPVPKEGVKTAAKELQLVPARPDMFDKLQ